MSSSLRSNWLPWVLVGALALLAALLFWKDSLVSTIGGNVVDEEARVTARFIGLPVPADYRVRSAGDGEARSLAEVVGANALIVVWSSGCDACQSLLAHYRERSVAADAGTLESNTARLFLFSRDANATPPASFPPGQFLLPVDPLQGTPLAGRVVPVQWRIDEDGLFAERIFGYESMQFDRLLGLVEPELAVVAAPVIP